ncbi:MAG: nicotinamide-nucleotide adenylyltransferase [Candidatus Poseidoniales archaeon]
MKKGLVLGRFQPFHLGHLELIKSIVNEQIEPLICIGSAQYSHSEKNPFTVEERKKMIEEVMKDLNCKYSIFGIPDINNYDLYVSHLETFVPSFDMVYSGNPIVQRLFAKAGYTVVKVNMFNREAWEGSSIRLAMKEDGDWESVIPNQVVNLIHDINGIDRLMN